MRLLLRYNDRFSAIHGLISLSPFNLLAYDISWRLTCSKGVNWALTGVSIALTGGRFAIRASHSRRLFWDDLVHLIALLVLIAHGVTNQITSDAKVQLANAAAIKGESQATLLNMYYHVRYLNTVNNCFLYLVFWVVKLSFLLFYRLLFETSIPFRRVWWAVLAFTLLTFWIPIAGVLATCANVNTVPEFSKARSPNEPIPSHATLTLCQM